MKVNQAEVKLAQKIAKKYSLVPPVNVKSILLDYANLEQDFLPEKVDAVCIINSLERPLVITDYFLPPTREKFTLAHELGHLIIPWHYGLISCHVDRRDEYDEILYKEMETEANNFAAELIMPSEWINQVISVELNNGLDTVLQYVTSTAEVSFSAAFFTVFNCLPKGIISYVENSHTGIGKFSETQDSRLFIPLRGDRSVAFEWLDNCSFEKNEYDMDTFTIKWWRIKESISESELNEIMEQLESLTLTGVLKKISEIDNGSLASVFEKLISKLPEGYVLSLENQYVKRTIYSSNTPIQVPLIEKSGDIDKYWMNQEADSYGVCDVHDYSIYWWRFNPKKAEVSRARNTRDSKEIFSVILNDTFTDEFEKISCMRSMAGIIGVLNNRNFNTFDEFYSQLTFRLTGDKKFEKIVDDPRLEDFKVNKIIELMNRKKK